MCDMTPVGFAEALGAEVRAELARQRKTQSDLAAALGVTSATAARRLDGTSPFDVRELAIVANWLGVSVNSLYPSDKAVPA